MRNTAVETRESTQDLRTSRSSPQRDISDHRGYASLTKAGQHIDLHAAYYITHERDVEEDYAYSSNSTYSITKKIKTSFVVLFTISA